MHIRNSRRLKGRCLNLCGFKWAGWPRSRHRLRHRRRRGFTLLEIGIATLMFSIIAGVTTLAISRVQLTGAYNRLQRSVEGKVHNLLAIASTAAYNELVDGTFVRPQACGDAIHQSCITVLGRNFVISWEITGTVDRTEISSANPSGIQLEATTTLPDGKTIALTQFVTSTSGGRTGTGLVRVRLSGQTYTGPVYLMTGTNTVAGSAIAQNANATIRADITDCTIVAPCHLALRPNGETLTTEASLDYETVAGSRSSIILSEASVAESGAVITAPNEIQILLLAKNSDGRRAYATTSGSVCLYLNFNSGSGTVSVPGCNTEQSDRIIWRNYQPIASNSVMRITLPTGAEMTVTTDNGDETCGTAGQTGWNGTTWVSAEVCTSWTWGTFDELQNGITGLGTIIDENLVTTNTGIQSATYYTAVWSPVGSGNLSIPAGGYAGDPLWAKPRAIPACETTSSCVPTVTNPESSCPGEHCNASGNAAPVVISPLRGSTKILGVVSDAGTSTAFSVIVTDKDQNNGDINDRITITVIARPAGLMFEGAAVTIGQELSVDVVTPAVINLTADASGTFTRGLLTLSITDGTNTRTETIILEDGATAPAVLTIQNGPIRLTQNSSGVDVVQVIGTNGTGMTSTNFSGSLPTGVAIGTVTNGGEGWFVVNYDATNATAGTTTYDLTSGSVTATANITVLGASATLTIDDATYNQGAAGTLTATLLDANGVALANEDIWFNLTAGGAGTIPLGSYPETRGCITNNAGTCSVNLTVEVTATTGIFTATATSDGATDAGTLTIAGTVARIESGGIVVAQGTSTNMVITAYDGRDEPAGAIALTAATTTTGLSVTNSVTTAANGTATLVVTAGLNAPAGPGVITITYGTATHTLRVKITSVVTEITVSGTAIPIAQYGNTATTVTARDPQGTPVPYVTLTVNEGNGVLAPATVITNSLGVATVYLTAQGGATLGGTTLPVMYAGNTLAAIPITVTRGIASIYATGTLTFAAVGSITVRVQDSDGIGLIGRSLAISSNDSHIVVTSPNVVSGNTGFVTVSLTTYSAPPGTYNLTVRTDGRVLTISVVVVE